MVSNARLQCYFLAVKVDSIELADKMGKAYYQVAGPQGPVLTANQVEEDGQEAL